LQDFLFLFKLASKFLVRIIKTLAIENYLVFVLYLLKIHIRPFYHHHQVEHGHVRSFLHTHITDDVPFGIQNDHTGFHTHDNEYIDEEHTLSAPVCNTSFMCCAQNGIAPANPVPVAVQYSCTTLKDQAFQSISRDKYVLESKNLPPPRS